MNRLPIFIVFAISCFLLSGLTAASAGENGSITGKVNAKRARYLEGAVIYLEKVDGSFPPPAKPARMDQQNQEFIPHVLAILKGTAVAFLNNDNTGHNVFTPDNETYDLGTWKVGETREYTFNKEGVYTQLCKMHPSMLAFIVVLQNPYFAVTGKDGSFSIDDVPPGEYTLKVWHERKKADPLKVKVNAGKAAAVEFKLHR